MRHIEDFEVVDMIEFLQASGLGIIIVSNTVAMLQELLVLRSEKRATMKGKDLCLPT